jgi:hypothetical protein
MALSQAESEIMAKVQEVLKTHPGGEKFFDALDGEIIGKASPIVMTALFDKVPKGNFIVLSGGFGRRVAEGIDKGELPKISYFLFQGGIRSGNQPRLIKARKFLGKMDAEGIFLDDSIYGGATYEAIKKVFNGKQKLTKCAVIYDGCPVQKDEVLSIFRYYDHFKATPNFKF